MTKEEILEGNKLIAEFIGTKTFHPNAIDGWKEQVLLEIPEPLRVTGGKTKSNYPYGIHLPPFHSSWDWLMPVVEKISRIEFHREMQDLGEGGIETIIYTHYPRTFGMLNNKTGKPMFRYNSQCVFEAETLIEAAWLATVDFIKFSQP